MKISATISVTKHSEIYRSDALTIENAEDSQNYLLKCDLTRSNLQFLELKPQGFFLNGAMPMRVQVNYKIRRRK